MSTNARIYLDFNATRPMLPDVARALAGVLADAAALGNPSSIHHEGRRARDLVERARDQVAARVGRPREHVIFTSGGSEANRLGLELLRRPDGATRVAVSPIEHPSLLGAARALDPAAAALPLAGARVLPPVDARVDVVAFGAVNHELGTVADTAAIAAAARAAGARVHVDAVQAAGKLDLAPLAAVADTLALSAHKLGGPAGVGALVVADPDRVPAREDGHQERGRRGGTENLLGIVGFGVAAAAIDLAAHARVAALGELLERELLARIPDARVHGADAPRIGGVVNLGFAGARGDAIVMALDLAGIAASTGAACTSGSAQPSAVLRALGESAARAREAVRISLGPTTTADELAVVCATLPAIVARARAASVRR